MVSKHVEREQAVRWVNFLTMDWIRGLQLLYLYLCIQYLVVVKNIASGSLECTTFSGTY